MIFRAGSSRCKQKSSFEPSGPPSRILSRFPWPKVMNMLPFGLLRL